MSDDMISTLAEQADEIARLRASIAEAKREGWIAAIEAAAKLFEDTAEKHEPEAIRDETTGEPLDEHAAIATVHRSYAAAILALTPPDFDAPMCKDSLQTGKPAEEQDDDVVPMSAETYSALRKIAAEIAQAQEDALAAENAKLREHVALLRAAAAPFCEYARITKIDGWKGEIGEVYVDGLRRAITFDQLERLSAALAATKPDEGNL